MSDRQKINEAKQKEYSCNLKLAKAGDPAGQHKVGWAYCSGEGVKKDRQQAFNWFLKSAEQGYYNAQCDVAFCYHYGICVDEDKEAAFKWRLKAAQQEYDMIVANNAKSWFAWYATNCYDFGHYYSPIYNASPIFHEGEGISSGYFCSAIYDVACCYYCGEGVVTDRQEAFRWFSVAAEQKHIEASVVIEYLYDKRRDECECVKLNKRMDACYRLNDYMANIEERDAIFRNCFDVEYELDKFQKFQLFVHWLELALHGNSRDQLQMGDIYCRGWGIEQDKTEAFRWFLKAAEQGNEEACLRICGMYERGDGVERDLEKAAQWRTRADVENK